jgi:hypothetical protein
MLHQTSCRCVIAVRILLTIAHVDDGSSNRTRLQLGRGTEKEGEGWGVSAFAASGVRAKRRAEGIHTTIAARQKVFMQISFRFSIQG